jgi:hypothetical protein
VKSRNFARRSLLTADSARLPVAMKWAFHMEFHPEMHFFINSWSEFISKSSLPSPGIDRWP